MIYSLTLVVIVVGRCRQRSATTYDQSIGTTVTSTSTISSNSTVSPVSSSTTSFIGTMSTQPSVSNPTRTSPAPNNTISSTTFPSPVVTTQTKENPDSTPLASSPEPGPLPSNFQTCLSLHNNARAQVGLSPLTSSPKLTESANAYAQVLKQKYGDRSLKLEHSNGLYGSVGENLYASTGRSTCANAMEYWVTKEKPLYKVGSNIGEGNFQDYGHYTQIVHRATTQVGCSSEEGGYFVCHYDLVQRSGKPAF